MRRLNRTASTGIRFGPFRQLQVNAVLLLLGEGRRDSVGKGGRRLHSFEGRGPKYEVGGVKLTLKLKQVVLRLHPVRWFLEGNILWS